MSLENMPVESRGLFSGFLQLGYPCGYLIIATVNLNKHVATEGGWRILFWTGAGFSLFAAAIRIVLPESQYFLDRKAAKAAEEDHTGTEKRSLQFLREAGKMLRVYWLRCIFGIIFMTCVTLSAHSIYPD